MSIADDNEDSTPKRFRRLRFNPLREILPYVCIILGIVMAARHGFTLAGNEGVLVICSLALVALGVIAIPVNLWLKKRGL
ncbi:hypothetical protein [Agreia sp.]|uniref:hypothetical protein n=1 Tax=Agreia sp. TaxID=1872416 RepID=UPI0035BC8BDF